QFMELLGRREQYHEALDDYKRLVTLLEQEEYQPDKQTQDLAEYLQLKQIQRPSVAQTLLLPSRSEAELDIVEAKGVVLASSNTSHPLFLSERTEQKHTTGVQQSFLDKGKVPSLEHFYGRGQELVEQPRDDEMHFPQFWNVPHLRNPFFTGREELLAHIYAIFLTEKTAIAVTQHALCGLGGIGKTQVALEYAYRYRHKYNAVFWIKADTRNNLLADFLSLATLLQLPERAAKDHSITIAAIKQWMRVNNAWLFILDNVDDLSLTREFLPTGHQGHILLTTRAQALGGLAYHIDVEEMTQETGALFLLRRIGQLGPNASPPDATHAQYQLAKNLVQELGGLPLALDQAGAYIEETSFGFQEYLYAYRAHRHVLLQRRGGFTTDHPEPVATTWSLSLDLVQQSDPIAVDFLRICAFLDPDVIPEEILSEGLAEFIAPHASNQANQIRFNEILSVLLRFSLIRRNMETRTITIHRLVQAMIQDTMEKEVQGQWAKRAVQAVQRTFPQPSIIYSAAGRPHSAIQLLSASVHLYREQEDTGQLAETLWKLAVQQQVIGHLRDAERNLFEGLSLCQGIGDWFNGAKTHQYFALLRMYQGLFPEALSHLDKALALFQTGGGTKAESTIYAYYALCYLHAHEAALSHDAAYKAHALAKENGDERDIIRSKWLLGWVCTQHSLQNTVEKKWLLEAEIHLNEALQRCRQSGMIDYEADILLAWARFSDRNGDDQQAEKYAKEAFDLTKKSAFDLLQADVCIFLAHLELKHGNHSMAQTYVSLARRYAYCDGFPYYYKAAVTEAERLLLDLNTLYTNNV
ncbi:MAG: NB-ARC domain-containing protein, partial [Ktedonobacteraceae bacterium]